MVQLREKVSVTENFTTFFFTKVAMSVIIVKNGKSTPPDRGKINFRDFSTNLAQLETGSENQRNKCAHREICGGNENFAQNSLQDSSGQKTADFGLG